MADAAFLAWLGAAHPQGGGLAKNTQDMEPKPHPKDLPFA